MGFFDGAVDFISGIGPLIGAGTRANTQNNVLDRLYGNAQANYDYINQENARRAEYNARAEQVAAANRAAAGRAAHANAMNAWSAANATEANAKKAAGRGQKTLMGAFDSTMGGYAPFKDMANTLLPQQGAAYGNALNTANMLGMFLQRPENMQQLNPAAPVAPKLPSYMRGS